MMTACRYACAIVVFLVASLTPTSCSDVSERAEVTSATVVSETVRAGDDSIERVGEGQEIGS